MTSFTSLLSSIGGGQPSAPQPNQTSTASSKSSNTAKPQALSNGARPAANNVAAGVKRKSDDQATPLNAKVIKTEVNVPVRPSGQSNSQPVAKPASSAVTSAAPYRGTARGAGGINPSTVVPKPVPKPSAVPPTSTTTPLTASNGAAKPKRGFASLMEKAKAAQEAAKAVGSSTIKHKPVEKLTKRDRQRIQEEAAKLKTGGKASKLAAADRSRSGTPVDGKIPLQKKQPESAYKGTMRKPVEKQESTYKGTMNKVAMATSSAKPATKKAVAQDKHGGYASWSDLDDVEDEEDYESDASSDMMDAGFDDMEVEERKALQAAKKEDQEALQEEERHRQEKLERKRKLQALSKNAAAKKKY